LQFWLGIRFIEDFPNLNKHSVQIQRCHGLGHSDLFETEGVDIIISSFFLGKCWDQIAEGYLILNMGKRSKVEIREGIGSVKVSEV
jgi:hypothetical protein